MPNDRLDGPPKLLSLPLWAERRFDPPPAERTLRRWAKAGQIVPAPLKIGKTWYVQPTALHIAEATAMCNGHVLQRL